jgi:hypothetical protein
MGIREGKGSHRGDWERKTQDGWVRPRPATSLLKRLCMGCCSKICGLDFDDSFAGEAPEEELTAPDLAVDCCRSNLHSE